MYRQLVMKRIVYSAAFFRDATSHERMQPLVDTPWRHMKSVLPFVITTALMLVISLAATAGMLVINGLTDNIWYWPWQTAVAATAFTTFLAVVIPPLRKMWCEIPIEIGLWQKHDEEA